MTLRHYRFEVLPGESHWETVDRLATEVGWDRAVITNLPGHDSELTPEQRLRMASTRCAASRAETTRAAFIERLCAMDGVKVVVGDTGGTSCR